MNCIIEIFVQGSNEINIALVLDLVMSWFFVSKMYTVCVLGCKSKLLILHGWFYLVLYCRINIT